MIAPLVRTDVVYFAEIDPASSNSLRIFSGVSPSRLDCQELRLVGRMIFRHTCNVMVSELLASPAVVVIGV